MPTTINLDLTEAQSVAVSYVTNLANKFLPDELKLTPEQYLTNALLNVVNSYVAQRSRARLDKGATNYYTMSEEERAPIAVALGIPEDFPTGNE